MAHKIHSYLFHHPTLQFTTSLLTKSFAAQRTGKELHEVSNTSTPLGATCPH